MHIRPLLGAAALCLTLATALPAQAQAPQHKSAPATQKPAVQKKPVAQKAVQNKPAAKAPARQQAATSRHHKACAGRYKSYDARSGTYVLRGKRVRCTL